MNSPDRAETAPGHGEHGPCARPRVLQVITKLDLGGAEVIALDLVSVLSERIDFAVATVLDVDPSPVGRAMLDTLARLKVPVFQGAGGHYKTGGALVAAWRLAKAVKRFRPDLVHLHTEMPELTWAIAGLLFAGVRSVPVLRTVHNSELWIAWGGIGRWVTDRLSAGRAIAVSQAAALADAAITTRHPRPRAEVVYNGVMPPERVVRDLAGHRSRGPVRVLFAGRLIEQKGADLLPAILAHAHAACRRGDVSVQIAGAGPLERTVRADLRAIAPEWAITVTPPIATLSQRLHQFDAIVMPSRFEGFGLLAIEALLAGTPLIATKAPGLIETLPEHYPFCAAVDDVAGLGLILASIIDAPEAARAATAGFVPELTRRFAPEVMVSRYEQLYRSTDRKRAA